jgi:hypothetical protein
MDEQKKGMILKAILLAAGGLLLIALGWFIYFQSQFGSYSDPVYKFSIKYPSSWQVVRAPQAGVAVVFISAKENAMDTFQEKVNVSIQDVPLEYGSMKSFSELIKKQMTAVFKSNINITEDKDIQLGNRKGHRMVFEAAEPSKVTAVLVWTIRGGQAYITTFLGKTNKYKENTALIEKSVTSFQLQ